MVNPLSMLCTHLTETVRNYAPELISRQLVQEMINQLRQKSPASVEGVVPEMLSLGDLQSVLRRLLRERVPIRDLSGILEVLANHAGVTRDPNILAEAVRQTMANTISALYRDTTNTLHVFTLAPQLEAALRQTLIAADGGPAFQIDANMAQKIIIKTGEQMESAGRPGLLPAADVPARAAHGFSPPGRAIPAQPGRPGLFRSGPGYQSQGPRYRGYLLEVDNANQNVPG